MMKMIISAVLTVSMILGASTVAYAKPKDKPSKPESTSITSTADAEATPTTKKVEEKKTENGKPTTKDAGKSSSATKKVEEKKDNGLEKSKAELIKKCDEMISQITKLKGYIVSTDGKFLVEFKDQATGDAVLKSIDTTINTLNSYKQKVQAATDSKVLKAISKELQDNLIKHQTIVKRITGLTSTARLKTAYDETKTLIDKLGAGINGITGSSITINVEELKKNYQELNTKLEEAHGDYLEAVALYSSIPDSTKSDKSFKEAQKKLMEAKDELHDVLIKAKQLLVKIKTSVHKQLDAIALKDEEETEEDKDLDSSSQEQTNNDQNQNTQTSSTDTTGTGSNQPNNVTE